jgi:hypothetical protein
MPMTSLSRRTVLRGAGTLAVALPWLEAMGRTAHARASGPARRFVSVYTPGGTVRAQWLPTGGERDFKLSPILAPLEPVRSKLLVLDGIDMASARGEQHQSGIVAWLTGTGQSGAHRNYASGPSIDQVIATRISKNQKRKASLQVAVRWATGGSRGRLHPINAAHFEDDTRFSPIPPRLDPKDIWDDLFGTAPPGAGGDAGVRLARKQSILDFVGKRYEALGRRLGAADRRKLDQHLTKIRELEGTLKMATTSRGTCGAPPIVDTSDYRPKAGLETDGVRRDVSTDAAIPKVGKFMMDMLVMALACDITAVASLQWSDTEAKHTFPWLNLREHHHYYQHDGGFRPREVAQISTWYSQQHAHLLRRMDEVDMGGHTLLDESVVFFGSELSDPPSHRKDNMPFLLAGRGGGLSGGRFLRYGRRSHNDLLVSILNLFGDPRTTFGDPRHVRGPLPNLT